MITIHAPTKRRLVRHLLPISATLMVIFALIKCATTATNPILGVQSGYEGFVPARIAVLPCQAWPHTVPYQGQALSNATAADLTSLCQTFDDAVLEAFNNQPFMNGFSPKYLTRLFAQSGKASLLEQRLASWQALGDSCMSCNAAAAAYKAQIQMRPTWQTWLNEFSVVAKRADAVLIPFVTYAYSQTSNDRGLMVAERAAELAVLLISTGRGDLIWTGMRRATVANKRLETSGVAVPLAFPAWQELQASLFTATLWRDFPGRQIF